ncbi:MAG: choice-of-anchor A family protein, partial [Bacteroidota bacterium]
MTSKFIKGRYFAFLFAIFTITAYTTAPTVTDTFFTKKINKLRTQLIVNHTASIPIGANIALINPAEQASGFNAFIKELVGTVHGDIEGPLALGGDLNMIGDVTVGGITTGNFIVGGDLHPTSLLIGGRIVYLSGTGVNVVNNGLVKLGDTTGSVIHDMLNGTTVNTRISSGNYDANPLVQLAINQPRNSVAQSNVLDFETIFTDFSAYSSAMSQLTSNLTITNVGTKGVINLAPNQLNVLNITGSDLASFAEIEFTQLPSANQPIIVNVDAAGVFEWTIPNFPAISDLQGPYILFNFYNTNFITFNGGSTISGTIFAPNADFTKNTSGNIAGQVISRIYTHVAGELHHYPLDFTVDLGVRATEICDDNIDNDGDGLIDCADPDCSATVILSATSATSCGDNITISANQCITYAAAIADTKGNVTNGTTTIESPDGAAAFFNEVSDGTYTRMVWDFGEVIPADEEVCFRVRCSSNATNSTVTIWLLESGTPESGAYDSVTTQSFVGTAWQDLCFTMPTDNRYVKITDDAGAPFYVDAVGRKCRDISDLSFKWNTGETTPTITVNGAGTATYSVGVATSDSTCVTTATIDIVGLNNCPEICGNGLDDDGDGFIDGGDTDCTTDCEESLLFVARDYGEILQVNLNTGATSIAGSSPFTNGNLNATAANPDAQIVYYGRGKNVYYWNPITNTHGNLVNLNGQVASNESLTSGGGAYFNNTLYLGFEDDNNADYPTIYALPLSEDGLSTTGNATNLNVPIPTNTSWGDLIVTAESGQTVIYAGLGFNGNRNESLYFKYEIENSTYTTIREDMPRALQIGVDVDGNLWGGGLATGQIQRMDKNTGAFSGSPIYIGGDMWDLTGPINCPQQIEICDNGQDDDGDGRIDNDDDDCGCPTIATTDPMSTNICAGETVTFTVMTDASEVPFHQVEFYRFTSPQSDPYTSLDEKMLVGAFSNDSGMGSVAATDFPTIDYMPTTYYVYALLNNTPSDLANCAPFLEYVVNVEACSELEINCTEGRTIQTYYTGLNYAVPKTMHFTDVANMDSIIVQIVYEDRSAGNSINIQDAAGNVYTLNRQIYSDIHLYEITIPPTSSIYYNNEANEDKAQSIVAYVYRHNQKAGSFARYSHAVSGHANTRTLNFPLPNRTQTEDFHIKLPLSELTYDDRTLTFTIKAGAYTNSFTRQWGPSGVNFTSGCCIELIEIEVPDVPASVDNISIEIFSPTMGLGQSYIVAGTVFLEIDCFDDEICDDGVDNDGDGDIDEQDLDCSGYCLDNGTFLPYGMLTLDNVDDMGWYSEQYNLTFRVTGPAFLIWLADETFSVKGLVSAYRDTDYVGDYTLVYTATGATYATFAGDNILGSTGGSGRLISKQPSLTEYDEILMSTQLNSSGLGLMVRAYDATDIRIEGDWSFTNWNTNNSLHIKVNPTDCQAPREICENGVDDDGDGLIDCDDFDCDNPNNSGTIVGNENNCGAYTPTEITEQNAPNGGGNGILEYEWEKSVDGNTWEIIPDARQANYTPPTINQTTQFRRKVRRGICNPWRTSNTINKTVTVPPFEAEIINVPIGDNGFLCAEAQYVFQAGNVSGTTYAWDFGPHATPSTANGIGPHEVVFDPSGNTAFSTEIVLTVSEISGDNCTATDNLSLTIRPVSEVLSVQSGDPTLCGAADGWIEVTASGEMGACIEVSLDGGVTYQPEGQRYFAGLSAGSYELATRYCNNDCPNVAQIVNLSDPATILVTNDDFVNVCPGFNFSSNVKANDTIRGATIISLASNGSFGSVSLEDNGDFVYTPNTPTCESDQFAYTVCDLGQNCCATAVVTINFDDDDTPTLVNVPEDLTINCDEEIPLPPLVSAYDNCPAIAIDKEEESTQGEEGCDLYDYTVTYRWIAEDYCGNSAVDSQLIYVQDITAPDIYRIYTLPSGKKMVAGMMENVTHRWKTIQLPLDFETTPLIFTQLSTNNEPTPAIARLRNVSTNQFEIKIQE